MQHVRNRLLDELLGLRIDGAGRLVEHEDARIGQHHAGERNQLLLPGGEARAALAHLSVIALVLPADEGVRMDERRGGAHLLIRRVRAAEADVVRNRAGEQMGRLQHIAQVRLQPELRPLPVVHPVDEDAPGRRLVKPAHEVHDRALARAGLSHERYVLAGAHVEREILQNRFALLIGEAHVIERHFAADRLPVLAPRVQDVPVLLHDLGRIDHLRGRVEQRNDAFGGGLRVLQLRKDARQLLDRIEHLRRIRDKRHERAHRDRAHKGGLPLQRACAAQHQRKAGADGAHRDHQREERGAQQRSADGDAPHVPGQLVELARVLFLAHERLGRHRAHDALVERAGDAAVLLARLPLVEQDAFLQKHADHRQRRGDRNDHEREPPVERKDRDDAAGHIEQRVQHVHKAPGDHLGQAPHVRNHARHQIAHGRPVVERKGQVLQLFKRFLPDGIGNGHLHLARTRDEHKRTHPLHGHERGVHGRKAPQPVRGFRRDERVDGIAREQRVRHVHERHDHKRQQNDRDKAAVAQRIGVQPLPDRQVDPFRRKVLFLDPAAHAAPPPSACMS